MNKKFNKEMHKAIVTNKIIVILSNIFYDYTILWKIYYLLCFVPFLNVI